MQLITGNTYRVYYNLHKHLLSVQAKTEKGWRVVAHVDRIAFKNARFVVYEKGRQRVIREKRKNVHAYVIGELTDFPESTLGYQDVRYNPYLYPSFMSWGEAIDKAHMCVLEGKKVKALK